MALPGPLLAVGLAAAAAVAGATKQISLGPSHADGALLPTSLVIDPSGGRPYIDKTTAFCYNATLSTDFAGSTLDQTYSETIFRQTINSTGARRWCQGNQRHKPKVCRKEGPPDSNASSACRSWLGKCVRGYDLLLWPPGASCHTPRILWVHGGSWTSGSPWDDSYPVHTSKIAHLANSVVFSVDFPLIGGWAEEGDDYIGTFQGSQDHVEHAWRWLASHGPNGTKCPGGHTPPLFVAGDSSGGGTALSFLLALRHKEKYNSLDGLKMPSGAFFESPWTNLACDTPSYYSNNFAALPNKSYAMEHPNDGVLTGDIWFNAVAPNGSVSNPWNVTRDYAKNGLHYCGKPFHKGTCGSDQARRAQLTDWLASPFNADRKHFQGLPPLYFATSASELLAGDTSVVAERASGVGVHVVAELFYGMWHTFPQWSEGCGSPYGALWQGKTALQHFGDFVKQVADAVENCPGQLRDLSGNVKTQSKAVNFMHQLTRSVPVTRLHLDICGDRPKPPPALSSRRKPRLRKGQATLDAADYEDAAMLQTSVSEGSGEEL